MAYPQIIILAGLLWLTACAAVHNVLWDFEKMTRKPGEKSLALPEAVWAEYGCANLRRPFIKVETNELIPPRLKPGGQFNHRLVYAMCSNERADEVLGKRYTRIYFKNRPVFNDVDESYAIKPGRWRVDIFIDLPEDAETGLYTLEVRFRSRCLRFRENHNFRVEPG